MEGVVVAPPVQEKPIQDPSVTQNDVKLFNRWTFEDVQVYIIICHLKLTLTWANPFICVPFIIEYIAMGYAQFLPKIQ